MTLCTPCRNQVTLQWGGEEDIKYQTSLADDETCGRCGTDSDGEREDMGLA